MKKLAATLLYLTSRPSFLFRKLMPTLRFQGIKVPTKGPHVTLTVWKHLWRQTYERPEIKALNALLQPNDRLLELGCGMGVVSAVAAKSIPGLTIRTYEANRQMLPYIAELHHLNHLQNFDVRNEILLPTAEEETRSFFLADSFAESSILKSDESNKSLDVPVRNFGSVLEEYKPDILMCDIEGAEAELFDGISLAPVRAAVVEFHPDRLSRSDNKRIFDTFIAAGLYPRVEYSSGTVVAFEKVD